jgi:hypothetical protein
MDLYKLIGDLYNRKQQLDRTIASLENLEAAGRLCKRLWKRGRATAAPVDTSHDASNERQQDSDA